MTGPSRVPPGTPTGEIAQPSETVHSQQPLAWQQELDGALTDIDSRLSHPRRRATDQPTLPQLGQPEISSEVMDEIAWRVSEMLRAKGIGVTRGEAPAAPIPQPIVPAPPPLEPIERMRRDVAIAIRVRRPLFSWPFRRRSRRRQSMITFSDYRVT